MRNRTVFPPRIFAKDLNVHQETDITKINYLQKYFNAKKCHYCNMKTAFFPFFFT